MHRFMNSRKSLRTFWHERIDYKRPDEIFARLICNPRCRQRIALARSYDAALPCQICRYALSITNLDYSHKLLIPCSVDVVEGCRDHELLTTSPVVIWLFWVSRNEGKSVKDGRKLDREEEDSASCSDPVSNNTVPTIRYIRELVGILFMIFWM